MSTVKKWWVYYLRDSRTNSILYVGQTKDPERRKKEQKRKYPLLEFDIQHTFDNPLLTMLVEWYLVEVISPPLNSAGGGGMNPMKNPVIAKKNGDAKRGNRLSVETKRKISDAQKGKRHSMKTRRKMSASHKGKKHSEEHRRKLSESLLGRKGFKHSIETREKLSESMKGEKNHFYGKKHNTNTKRKIGYANKGGKSVKAKAVLCISPTGQVYRYDAAREAAREIRKKHSVNCGHSDISLVATGKREHHKQWRFEYV